MKTEKQPELESEGLGLNLKNPSWILFFWLCKLEQIIKFSYFSFLICKMGAHTVFI